MKKIFLCLFLFPAVVSFAAPTPTSNRMSTITSMTITYDLAKTTLHIEAEHPSDNWEIDYIRLMTISLNGQVISTQNLYHQTSVEFTDDVPFKAQVGDVIKVDLYCTGGSGSSQELTVTQQDGGQPDQSTGAGTAATTANSTIGNIAY